MIKSAPIIAKLLDKVPADMRASFSDEQLQALKVWDWFKDEFLR